MNKRNLNASFASEKMKWRRFFIVRFRPCAWRVVGVGRYFLNYIYTRCGKIQDLYFSTPIYKKLEKPVPTRQPVKFSIVRLCFYSCLTSVNQVDIIPPYIPPIIVWRICLKSFTTFFLTVFASFSHTCMSVWKNTLTFWFECTCIWVWTYLRFDSNAFVFHNKGTCILEKSWGCFYSLQLERFAEDYICVFSNFVETIESYENKIVDCLIQSTLVFGRKLLRGASPCTQATT